MFELTRFISVANYDIVEYEGILIFVMIPDRTLNGNIDIMSGAVLRFNHLEKLASM